MSDVPPSPVEPFRPLPDRSWRERVEELAERVRRAGRPARVVAAVGVSVGLAVVAVALLRPAGADPNPEATLPRASESPPASAAAPAVGASTAPTLVVQAAGAVVHPGLYRLPPGSRVDDLVTAAGGLAPDADQDRINLAAPVVDGQKVYVPRAGEPIPADAAPNGASGSTPAPIDLNTATAAQLDALPGVGPSTAQAIVDYRSQHGRFRSVDDLLNVRGIGAAKLEQIRPLVRV